MARMATIATGNFTTAGTWGLVNATLYANSETSSVVCATSYGTAARSATATPGAITVSHIGVKLSVRTGTTGTMTVHIATSAHVEVPNTAVTINTGDLPVAATADLNGGWHFFKLGTPVTLTAATLYEVEALTSSASQISLFASAATVGMSCALITTTTGAPVAGDDFIINGEYTGQGTSNSFTVIMNQTATTDYGSTPTAANSLISPIAICNKGSLVWGTTAATNYNLKLSNSLIIYSGGIYVQGSNGAECPRDSSMQLQFDCGANVDYGFTRRDLGNRYVYGLSRTIGKDIYFCYLNTDEAVNSTSLGVDRDTGWLTGDAIAVASTTRTASQCEAGTLNGAAGASTLTVNGFAGAGGGVLNAHSGTSPTQAEVILLTRNVRIIGVSTTLQTYIVSAATGVDEFKWCEFKWLGSATSSKRGIDVNTSTGSFSATYCSFRDFVVANSNGLNWASASNNNITCSYNVFWNIASNMISCLNTTNTNIIVTYCILMRNISGAIYNLGAMAGTIDNINIIGAATYGILTSGNGGIIGTMSNIIIHSCASYGFNLVSTNLGTIDNLTIYRNTSIGLSFTAGDTIINNLVAFGNGTANIEVTSGAAYLTLYSPILNGDTTFSTNTGISSSTSGAIIKIYSGDFSTVTGIKTAHAAQDILTNNSNSITLIKLINTKLGATSEINGQTTMLPSSMISSQKHDQTAGLHKTWKRQGTITIETTTTQAGGQSMKMTPLIATEKLESSGHNGGFKVAVTSGQTCTPTIYVYEDASYNGARARLIVKRNDALGITADTVLATATAASDAAWEALTGTTIAATDNGVMEFVVDCNGTAGNLFVDTFTCVNA